MSSVHLRFRSFQIEDTPGSGWPSRRKQAGVIHRGASWCACYCKLWTTRPGLDRGWDLWQGLRDSLDTLGAEPPTRAGAPSFGGDLCSHRTVRATSRHAVYDGSLSATARCSRTPTTLSPGACARQSASTICAGGRYSLSGWLSNVKCSSTGPGTRPRSDLREGGGLRVKDRLLCRSPALNVHPAVYSYRGHRPPRSEMRAQHDRAPVIAAHSAQ